MALQLTFRHQNGPTMVTNAVCVVGNALSQPICILNGASPSTATGMDLNFILLKLVFIIKLRAVVSVILTWPLVSTAALAMVPPHLQPVTFERNIIKADFHHQTISDQVWLLMIRFYVSTSTLIRAPVHLQPQWWMWIWKIPLKLIKQGNCQWPQMSVLLKRPHVHGYNDVSTSAASMIGMVQNKNGIEMFSILNWEKISGCICRRYWKVWFQYIWNHGGVSASEASERSMDKK